MECRISWRASCRVIWSSSVVAVVTSTASVSECRAAELELILADGDETDALETPLPLLLPLLVCPTLESRRMMLPRRVDEAHESLRLLMLPLPLWLFAVAEAGRRPRFFTSRL